MISSKKEEDSIYENKQAHERIYKINKSQEDKNNKQQLFDICGDFYGRICRCDFFSKTDGQKNIYKASNETSEDSNNSILENTVREGKTKHGPGEEKRETKQKSMLTRPFTRLVVAFGQRKVTQRRLVEEIVLGILILVPLGFVVGLITSRICTKIHFSSIRSDIWTTIVVFLIGDVLMEWLLPSLSCLPIVGDTGQGDEYYYTISWLLQSYGISCPEDFPSSTNLLSPDATAILFSLRLVFLCLGVHIGESLCFVALTGGIATGKSTVSRLLVEYNTTQPTQTSSNNAGNRRKSKKGSSASSNNNSNNNNNNATDNNDSQVVDDYKEGTVNLICADSIAHEILLPPSVLANQVDHLDDDADQRNHGDDSNNNNSNSSERMQSTNDVGNNNAREDDDVSTYIVHPKDSVYPQILSVFEGQDILTADGRIDRLKLGAIVFKDRQQRRILNRITHPRIAIVLIQQLLKGVFFGSCDITVADVPLLFESGKLSWMFAVTICVTIKDPAEQLERLIKRNPELSREECQARIASQLPLSKKEKLADIVIDNSGSLEELSEQVEEVRKDLMGRLYGIGMSLLQMLLLIGGSTSIAVSSKFYSHWQQ